MLICAVKIISKSIIIPCRSLEGVWISNAFHDDLIFLPRLIASQIISITFLFHGNLMLLPMFWQREGRPVIEPLNQVLKKFIVRSMPIVQKESAAVPAFLMIFGSTSISSDVNWLKT